MIFILIATIVFSFFISPQNVLAFQLQDGVLIKSVNSPKVYFVENGLKRWIKDEKIFKELGFSWDKILTVSETELLTFPEGSVLNNSYYFPNGMLIRKKGDYKIYLVSKSSKRWIKDEKSFKNMGYDWNMVFEIDEERFNRLKEGKPIVQRLKIISPETIFTKTPKSIIEDTRVEFEFNARLFGNLNNLYFDTFLVGVDKNWVRIRSKKRIINLPKKSGNYIFYIRAIGENGIYEKIPKRVSFLVKLSPYFDKIYLYGSPRETDPQKEYVVIKNRSNDSINLTGWYLSSEKYGGFYKIPKVYQVPNHSYYNQKIDVVLNKRGALYVISGRGPFGDGFLVNRCMSYLADEYKFYPSISSYMCYPKDEDKLKRESKYCQKVISQTPSCKTPNLNDFLLDSSCREFIRDNLTYFSCVNKNIAFYDFFKNDWRVYLGYQSDIWKNEKDSILLRDKNGLLVARYSY